MKAASALLVLFALIGCDPQTAQSKFKDIPPVRLTCQSADHADCTPAKAGRSFYVGLTASPVDCGPYLLSQSTALPLRHGFDAFGSALSSVNGTFLVGTVNYWVNFGGIQLYDLPVKTHTVCAFIDENGDERWTVGEPLSQGELTPGSNEVLLDIWN